MPHDQTTLAAILNQTSLVIHILDTPEKPEKGTSVTMNCGAKVVVDEPIAADFDDGRICEGCLIKHRSLYAKMVERLKPLKCFTFLIER